MKPLKLMVKYFAKILKTAYQSPEKRNVTVLATSPAGHTIIDLSYGTTTRCTSPVVKDDKHNPHL